MPAMGELVNLAIAEETARLRAQVSFLQRERAFRPHDRAEIDEAITAVENEIAALRSTEEKSA
jgi:hypothetical protein